MIELYTGLPGAGKTLRAIERGMELKAAGRRVFYLDINGLEEEGTGFEPFPGQFSEWQSILQPGEVLIVDEVQRFIPSGMTQAATRREGAVPAWIEALTRNRHSGIDLVLITQHPMLIDGFVRRLVNTHVHALNVFGKEEANLYTWIQVCEEPESKSKRMMADVRRWKYPTEVYKLYKSAELHTRVAQVPRMVKVGRWAIGVFVVLSLGVVVFLWYAFGSKAEPSRSDGPQPTTARPARFSPFAPLSSSKERPPLTPAEWVQRQVPRVPGVPWSAPLWDERRPRAEPEIYCALMEAERKCICHSEQGTRIQVSYAQCGIIATVGVYNPYREPVREMRARDDAKPSQDAPEPKPAASAPAVAPVQADGVARS